LIGCRGLMLHRLSEKRSTFLTRSAQFIAVALIPTVSHLLIPIASRNLLLLLSLPTRIQHRQAKARRRKDEHHVGTAARGIIERLSRLPRGVHPTHRPSGRVCRALSTRAWLSDSIREI